MFFATFLFPFHSFFSFSFIFLPLYVSPSFCDLYRASSILELPPHNILLETPIPSFHRPFLPDLDTCMHRVYFLSVDGQMDGRLAHVTHTSLLDLGKVLSASGIMKVIKPEQTEVMGTDNQFFFFFSSPSPSSFLSQGPLL